MQDAALNAELLSFLDRSPTPFHAVAEMKKALLAAGFKQLLEQDSWDLKPAKSYFVIRNDASIIAFSMPEKAMIESGIRLVGAHTDSPCLKLKPQPETEQHGYQQLGVEVYGGVLLNPWFDRDLSLAGRVTIKTSQSQLHNRLVDFQRAIAIIPSLAIHLDRNANEKRHINKQTDLPPVLGLTGDGKLDIKKELHALLKSSEPDLINEEFDILDFELSFYSTEKAALIGLENDFIASARLDNLLSCFLGLQALIKQQSANTCQLLVCNDHEEVGSGSSSGARGNFLSSVLKRIAGDEQSLAQIISNSMLISTDNAHALHPNYADKHDPQHQVVINAGPVIKINSDQAYASNSETVALFQHMAELAQVETQKFVSKSDLRCGSTIGPLTATNIGVRTVDVGLPTFAMHSIRELAGSRDTFAIYEILTIFYSQDTVKVSPV